MVAAMAGQVIIPADVAQAAARMAMAANVVVQVSVKTRAPEAIRA